MAITERSQDGVLLNSSNNPILFPEDGNYRPAAVVAGLNGDNVVMGQMTLDGKLRVDATVNPTGDVILKALDLTDTLQDLRAVVDPITTKYALLVQDPRFNFTGGSLNVSVSATAAGTGTAQYNELTAVASGATQNIVVYTVPVAKTFTLSNVISSGTNAGIYVVYQNANVIAKKRSYFTDFNADFEFGTVTFVAGDVLTIEVTNAGATPADFNAGAYGNLS